MVTLALEARKLTKRFRDKVVVQDVSFSVATGSVFGFLGQNGAGKTTTIRMLLGLSTPSDGTVLVEGLPFPHRAARVGAVLEEPGFYPRMTARKNLELLSQTAGIESSRTSLEALIERVGLTAHTDKRVEEFSFGMKQRLSIAAALLNDPELVIMDEPTKAMDPQGIRDIRRLIEELRAKGKTVFLSSHLLTEVEQVCDQVAVISNGRIVAEGMLASFLGERSYVRVVVEPTEIATSALLSHGWAVQPDRGGLIIRGASSQAVNEALTEAGVIASEVSMITPSLEDVFLRLVEAHDSSQSSFQGSRA